METGWYQTQNVFTNPRKQIQFALLPLYVNSKYDKIFLTNCSRKFFFIFVPEIPSLAHLAAGSTSSLISTILLQPLDVIKTKQQQLLINPTSRRLEVNTKYRYWSNFLFSTFCFFSALFDIFFLSFPFPFPFPSSLLLSRGMFGTLCTVVREDGIRGLWRGTAPSLYRTVPGSGVYFFMLSNINPLVLFSLNHIPWKQKTNRQNQFCNQKLNKLLVMMRTCIQLTKVLKSEGSLVALLSGFSARTLATITLMPFTVIKTRFEVFKLLDCIFLRIWFFVHLLKWMFVCVCV